MAPAPDDAASIAAPFPELAKEIFFLALDLEPSAREDFVQQRCGANQSLAATVREMLRLYFEPATILRNSSFIPLDGPDPAWEPFQGNGRFRLIRQLGSGGFGKVFEAHDLSTDATVALKVLNRPEAVDLVMFKREFHALADVRHVNIVELYELFQDSPHWFFTMELVRGTDIVSYAAGSTDRARAALAQLVQAVRHLHGCDKLHRDIKPSNVRVTPDGKVKLLDFGMVRDISDESRPETLTIGGTAAYMAPELWKGRKLHRASDWYSVGVVLYEALTGRPPFEGSFFEVLERKNQEPIVPPKERNAAVPDDLNELCLELLDPDPANRPNADSILAHLSGIAPVAALSAPQATPLKGPHVGRNEQLAQLQAALAGVQTGRTACVWLDGPSGIGKTSLCTRFLAEARRQGAVVLSGRCYQSDSVPFKALDPIVDALSEYLKALRGSECEAFLPLRQNLSALAVVFPALLAVDPIRQQYSKPSEKIGAGELQRRAIAALKDILARVGQKFPCIVHVDDFQWGDLDSVRYFAEFLGSGDPPRVLFLFSYRSEDSAFVGQLRRPLPHPGQVGPSGVDVRSVHLAPLDVGECRELLRLLLGAGADALSGAVFQETAGLPLFIHELALYARPHAALTRGISLPEVIGTRVNQLPDAAKRMLEIVSLAAQPVPVVALRRAVGLGDAEPATRSLLLANRLIRVRNSGADAEIEPYHDKIRETVASSIPNATKRAHYGVLLSALGERPDADPEVIYRYALEAGEVQKAAQWLEIAAKRAESALAFELASELHAERLRVGGVTESQRSFLLEDQARTVGLAGKGDLAAKLFLEAARGASTLRELRLIRKAGEQYVRSGDFVLGQTLLTGLSQRVGFRLPATDRRALASLVAFRALLFFIKRPLLWLRRAGRLPVRTISAETIEKLDICRVTSLALALNDPVRSAELQARHLLLSLWLGEPYRIANSLSMEAGYVAARKGARGYSAALKLLKEVKELAEPSNHDNRETLTPSVHCKVAWLAGKWQESALAGAEVKRLATEEKTQIAWEAYPSSIFWMCSLACMGQWRQVIDALPSLRREGEARESLLDLTSLPILTFAYTRHLLEDDPRTALQQLLEARNRLRKPGYVPHRFGVWFGIVESSLYWPRPNLARIAARRGWRQLDQAMALRLQSVRILMLHVRARAACAAAVMARESGRAALFAEALSDARAIRKEDTVWGGGLSSLIEAAVAASQRRFGDCSRLLNSAERAFETCGMAQFLAAARYRKAGLPAEFMDEDARAAMFKLASGWFTEQQVHNPDRMVQMLCPGIWGNH